MTDEALQPEFALQLVYLKDCSFEAPNGPRFDPKEWNPQIALDLNTQTDAINDDTREITLTINVTAKLADKTAFIAEVKQSGAFTMRNLSEEDMRRAVASAGPSMLFPYARAVVTQLVGQGGFPQLLLPPVNFDALYARSLAEAQQAQEAVKN
jgi:preprotein translocase subunit SecB